MFNSEWKRPENEASESEDVLRQGLRLLPVPDASPDFDARIHAALRQPTPWWKSLWNQARPVLVTAACSFTISLAILKGLSIVPVSAYQPGNQQALAVHRDSERMTALEDGDLSRVPLNGFASLHISSSGRRRSAWYR